MNLPLKTALLASLGTALDYYDFVLYILLSAFIAPIFFSGHSPFIQMMNVLGIFAAGYVARPLGGFAFGHFADRYGRKKVFLSSILLMAGSTFALGLLPGYARLGALSIALLLICRILQGLAQGAEIPGAITFVAEHAPQAKRAFLVSLALAGAGLGAMLASLINSILLHFLSTMQMLQFGWRLPFLLGGTLAIVGFIIRKNSTEPSLFLEDSQRYQLPLLQVLRQHQWMVLRGMGVITLPGSLILFGLFLPNYLLLHFAYPLKQTYAVFTVSLVESAGLILLSGFLVDRLGLKRLFSLLVLMSLMLLIPIFQILKLKTTAALWIFLLIYEGLIGLMSGCYPPFLAQIFPTPVRMSAVAISYNLAYLLIGFVPMLGLYLIQISHNPQSIAWLMLGAGLISALCLRGSLPCNYQTHSPSSSQDQ